MKTFPKGSTIGTNQLQRGQLLHMHFVLYNVTSVGGFTSMLTVVCGKIRIIWVFPTAPKQAPVCIILFMLTKLKNEQHPFKCVRVEKDGAVAQSTDLPTF